MKIVSKKYISLLCALMLGAILCAGVASAESGIVNLNKATQEEISALFVDELGLPEGLAKALVDYRTANGPFKASDDLLKVPGMTQDFIEDINPQVKDGDVIYDPDAEPALAPSKC